MIVAVGYLSGDGAPSCLSEVFPHLRHPLKGASDLYWVSEVKLQDSIFDLCTLKVDIGQDGELTAWVGIKGTESRKVDLYAESLPSITSVDDLDLWVYKHLWRDESGSLQTKILAQLEEDA